MTDPQPRPQLPRLPLQTLERLAIEDALAETNGNVQEAARILGVAPSTIYRKRQVWAAA